METWFIPFIAAWLILLVGIWWRIGRSLQPYLLPKDFSYVLMTALLTGRLLVRSLACLAFALLLGGLCAAPAAGQLTPDPDRRVSLEEALQLFRENNLSLLRARSEVAAMEGLARQAAAYPNPSIQASHEPVWRDGTRRSETYLYLSQQIGESGRRARVEAARQQVSATRARTRADSLRLVFDVAEAYVQTTAAEARLRRLESVTRVFRQADSAFVAREAEGEASGYAVRRVRLERARYEQRLASARVRMQTAQRQLAALILPNEASTVAADPLPRVLPPALAEEEAMRAALRRRPELQRRQAEIDAQQATLQSARRAVRPDPTVTAGYKDQSDGFAGVFVGVSFQLPAFNRNRGQVEAEAARLTAARITQQLALRELRNEVRYVHSAYASLRRQSRLIGPGLLSGSDDLLRIAQTSYAEGEMSLLELLDAADAYRDAQTRMLDLRADLWMRYFDLLRTMDRPIRFP